MLTILGMIASAAIVFGAFNLVGDVVLFNRDAPTSERVWDAAWRPLLLFVALSLWAAVAPGSADPQLARGRRQIERGPDRRW